MTFRILTWNIKSGHFRDQSVRQKAGTENLNQIAEVIKNTGVSAVCLQEVDAYTKRARGVHQAKYLVNKLKKLTGTTWYYQFLASIAVSSGYYGNAILSSYPIETTLRLHMPKIKDKENRSFLLTRIQLSNTNHLYVGAFHLGFKDKEAQAQSIKKALSDNKYSNKKIIIGGDLNAPKNSIAYNIICSSLFYMTDIGPFDKCTLQCYNNFKNPKIDFFFTTTTFNHLKGKVLDIDISDHRPIVADIK